MDQYKENENNLENNPTNENDGREPVIPEPEFEEVKTQQAKESEPQTGLDGVTQAHDADTTQFTVENTSESKNANVGETTQEFETRSTDACAADGGQEHSGFAAYDNNAQDAGYTGPQVADSGEYTWQNPNPYANYSGYTGYGGTPSSGSTPKPEKQKKKLSGSVIALIGVSCVAFVLLLAVIVMFFTFRTSNRIPSDNDNNVSDNANDNSDNTDKSQNSDVNLPSLETQQPTTDALSVPQIYDKVKDSVVGIIVTVTNGAQIGQGSGTGIILSEDGYIATNAHVVDGAASIKVVLTDESEYTAQLIGADTRTDLAVLKIDKTGLKPAEFGDSDKLVVGETVVAIGNPYGLELAGTVTSGIVSALNRRIAIENVYMTLIQTDASINPGNSGGPLVNAYGQVIGITSSKIVTSGYEGIGFAIPITGATDIIEELIQYGYIKDRPYIGIQGSDLDATYAQMYNIPQGIYVQYVDPESDAYSKGLKKGDIITAVNGVKISNMAELDEQKNNHSPGDTITLSVYRNTRTVDIKIILSESSGN